MTTINELCQSFYDARRIYEEAKWIATERKREMDAIKSDLIDEMLNSRTRAVDRDDGTRISLRRNFSCSVTKDNQQQIRDWLLATTGDDTPFVREVVDKKVLSEELRSMVDERGVNLSDLPVFLKVDVRPNLSVYGWKADFSFEGAEEDS
jgi:hypothetical protein